MDGINTKESASFNPMANTNIGKHVVENPKPVMPLAVAAHR